PEMAAVDIAKLFSGPLDMFCNQCEQAAGPLGCTVRGVCGKQPTTSAIQDLIVEGCHVFGALCTALPDDMVKDEWLEVWEKACFTTLTNVSFDDVSLKAVAETVEGIVQAARALVPKDHPVLSLCGTFHVPSTVKECVKEGRKYSQAETYIKKYGLTLGGLREFIMHGVKGLTAYADHVIHIQGADTTRAPLLGAARVLGEMQVKTDLGANDLLGLAMEIGRLNLSVIEALDAIHVETFGQPTLTPVPCRPRPGKCILITGHDLKDLESLLQITDKLGITVYTHGEMIPGHAYPKLHEHPSLYGNYGTAWQNQVKEFPDFPGPMLFTTNCIQQPRPSYAKRVFTTGRVAFPNCQHLEYGKWQPLIDSALAAPGFTEEECLTYKDESLLVGAHHSTVLGLAPEILDLVGKGALKHFWFIGGCDGAKPGRNYFSKLAMDIPDDHIILTGACGRFRINRLKDYGDIEGIPRLLDVGQCNDVYSAIRIAMGLAEALQCDINDLPLSLVVSWYEQKAVVQLLTLLHLGLKNIKLGPSLPKCLSPEVINVLVDAFGISLTDPEKVAEDIAAVTGQ
ncbi:hydroxylamine reductase, partial [Kipferlia bialata]